jgi:uncharacterized protein YqhQ
VSAADGRAPLRLGGMALRNGLLVHGPTHWAAAVRVPDGAIRAASGRKPRVRAAAIDRLPGARGVVRLGEAMAVIPLVKLGLPEARLPWQDLAAYHGVEHKAIAAYENGDADARDAAKEHDRCGSHLMAPLLASNAAGTALLKRLVERPTQLQGAAVQLASVGLAVEVFAWSERHDGSVATRALRRPGHELQRLIGTREPTEDQLDVGRAALAEILRAEGVAGR